MRIGLIALSVILSGCATLGPQLAPPHHQLGPWPYQVGEWSVAVVDPKTATAVCDQVEMESGQAPQFVILANGDVQVVPPAACIDWLRKRIYLPPSVFSCLHEFKHVLEPDWIHPVYAP